MTTLGFVVLAKRPAPRTEHGWEYETVSGLLPLDQAQDAQQLLDPYDDVEFVVGEIRQHVTVVEDPDFELPWANG